MREPLHRRDPRETAILMGLLGAVLKDGEQSQRRMASELGVALGLVNAYLKRCIRKGLVKASKAPARRYAYYLTPRGFAEKSRLTIEFMSHSLSFFREAKADLSEVMRAAEKQGLSRIALLGISDLAEIAVICAIDCGVTIVVAIDSESQLKQFMSVPVIKSFNAPAPPFDAILVTDVNISQASIDSAARRLGSERILIPKLIGVHVLARGKAAP
jgi:DNA-binding MarR family transcriptional regulator